MPWRLVGLVFVVVSFCGASGGSAQGGASSKQSLATSVVEVRVIADAPDLLSPWQTEGIEPFGGSGVIIVGDRVLTNAHVVENAVAIEVKRPGVARSFPARVAFISHDADLALLEVPDEAFFEGAKPVPLGPMPKLRQTVDVYGFPIGGSTLSITSGIVSRIEVELYAQSLRELLAIQIDAAINFGNSGGPIMSDGKVVGIAMQTYGSDDAENVGYAVPSPVVAHFLDDVQDGRYDGYPALGANLQKMRSPALRQSVGMRPEQTGGFVIQVDYGSPAHGALRPGDVILAIDGRPIANDLTIEWSDVGRVDYTYAVQQHQVGEAIPITFLRDGKVSKKSLTLRDFKPLVPGRRTTDPPRYYIFGGLVFQPLSEEFIDEPGVVYEDADVYATSDNVVTKERREVILLQRILPDRVNRGYQRWGGEIVHRVNGVVPRDLDHLVDLIEHAQGRWLRLVLSGGYVLTLDLKEARASASRILDSYGIPEDRELGTSPRPSKRARRKRR
ncbi:MAG: trypsin-like peptidase domain-containing protein [Myxococcota bacterium]